MPVDGFSKLFALLPTASTRSLVFKLVHTVTYLGAAEGGVSLAAAANNHLFCEKFSAAVLACPPHYNPGSLGNDTQILRNIAARVRCLRKF